MRPLLKPDPHILLKAIEDPTNPIGMSMIFKKNVLKMPGTEHSHSVFSEEFRALRHDLLPTPLLSLDSFLCSSLLPPILLRNVANRYLALEGPLFDSF